MKKILIYGCGRVFKRIKDQLKDCEVIAVVDKNARELQMMPENQKFHLITPGEISGYNYDYIAISTPAYYAEIRLQLIVDYGVPEEKILSAFLFVDGDECFQKSDVEAIEQHYASMGANVVSTDSFTMLENSLREGIDNKAEQKYVIYFTTTLPSDNEMAYLKSQNLLQIYARVGALIFLIKYDYPHIQKDTIKKDTKIYVVTHKEYPVFEDDLYTPITVGGYEKKGMLTDSIGENIAYLNEKINECTAMYWIWKNSDADVVGINHYRRFFYKSEFRCREHRLDKDTIDFLLKENDIITYRGIVPCNQTVGEELRGSLDDAVYLKGYELIKKYMEIYQPESLPYLDKMLELHDCRYCNMMIAKKEVYDAYCEWLFSFLIATAEEMDITGLDNYNKRIIGFWAERMLTVWLEYCPQKETSLPIYIP